MNKQLEACIRLSAKKVKKSRKIFNSFDIEKTIMARRNKCFNQTCCICMGEANLDSITTQCNHLYCKNCLIEWLKNNDTCPICKELVSLYSILENDGFQN